MSWKEKVLKKVHEHDPIKVAKKVSIIGVGAVGMACAITILTKTAANDVAIVDLAEDKVKGEVMDLQHGSYFMRSANLQSSTDYAVTENSRIIIITAGARQQPGESRLNLVQRNVDILKGMIPKLMTYNKKPVIIMVSNPVDVLTHVAWKLSGLPQHRVIGAGTNLDSLRFRYLLAKELGVAVESVHAFIIGEHGDSSVPVWSEVNVGGVRIQQVDPDFGKKSEGGPDYHREVVHSPYEIIKLKGSTCWAIGLSVMHLVNTILSSHNRIHPITTSVRGLYGLEQDSFLSLPCVLGPDGISAIVRLTLTDDEREKLAASAKTLREVFDGIQF